MRNLRQYLSRVSHKRRRTKIVATVGPSSSSDAVIEGLIVAGVDVFRLNFSHGNHVVHGENIQRIRRIAARLEVNTAILGDLCGPKIRVGMFEDGGIELATGSRVLVTTRAVEGRVDVVPSQYADLAKDVATGNRILLDDGKLELRVRETDGVSEILCDVVAGGRLSNKKGMNLPGVAVSAPALTGKDRADAEFAAGHGVDFLALSFVRTSDDIGQLRTLLDELGHHGLPIIAKIEKPEALDCIEAILDCSDGIMVARGDLGVEMPAEEVPLLQNELIRIAIERNRPVIVATQMLESMIENTRPTRAEVTDVASAAMARTDAVMLSAETAAGSHPIAAVAAMDRILRLVEGYQLLRGEDGRAMTRPGNEPTDDPNEALSRATSLLSANLGVRAIVVPTRSGRTARLVAAERPSAPVIALALDDVTCRRLSLLWGVTSQQAGADVLSNPRQAAVDVVQSLGLAADGQTVLLVWDASSSAAGPGLASQVEPTVSILSVRK